MRADVRARAGCPSRPLPKVFWRRIDHNRSSKVLSLGRAVGGDRSCLWRPKFAAVAVAVCLGFDEGAWDRESSAEKPKIQGYLPDCRLITIPRPKRKAASRCRYSEGTYFLG